MSEFRRKFLNRKSIRLKEYDYSQSGAYFITVCTNNRELILNASEVINMLVSYWKKLPEKFTNLTIDEFVVMPNHIHGIFLLTEIEEYGQNNISVGADPCVCPNNMGEYMDSPLRKIGNIVQWYKTMTTNQYIKCVKNSGWKPFEKKLWQRNYYEHIIRNEEDLHKTKEYILNNPIQWNLDKNNPLNW